VTARVLYDIEEVQYDENDDDYDQNVNPGAEVREAWDYVRTQKAEQPQDD
jgi:hypothetical protein